jgi:hypothetical protein
MFVRGKKKTMEFFSHRTIVEVVEVCAFHVASVRDPSSCTVRVGGIHLGPHVDKLGIEVTRRLLERLPQAAIAHLVSAQKWTPLHGVSELGYIPSLNVNDRIMEPLRSVINVDVL